MNALHDAAAWREVLAGESRCPCEYRCLDIEFAGLATLWYRGWSPHPLTMNGATGSKSYSNPSACCYGCAAGQNRVPRDGT